MFDKGLPHLDLSKMDVGTLYVGLPDTLTSGIS